MIESQLWLSLSQAITILGIGVLVKRKNKKQHLFRLYLDLAHKHTEATRYPKAIYYYKKALLHLANDYPNLSGRKQAGKLIMISSIKLRIENLENKIKLHTERISTVQYNKQ